MAGKGYFARLLSRKDDQVLLKNAEAAVASIVKIRAEFETEKLGRVQRQMELWSRLSLSPDLEDEYMSVGRAVEKLSKKLFVVDAFARELLAARTECRDTGDCIKLLKVPDIHEFLEDGFLDTISISQGPPIFMKG